MEPGTFLRFGLPFVLGAQPPPTLRCSGCKKGEDRVNAGNGNGGSFTGVPKSSAIELTR